MFPGMLVDYTQPPFLIVILQRNKVKLAWLPQGLFLDVSNYMLANWYFLPSGWWYFGGRPVPWLQQHRYGNAFSLWVSEEGIIYMMIRWFYFLFVTALSFCTTWCQTFLNKFQHPSVVFKFLIDYWPRSKMCLWAHQIYIVISYPEMTSFERGNICIIKY